MRKFGKLNNIFIPSYVKKNKYINTNSEQPENQTNKTSNDLNTKNQNSYKAFQKNQSNQSKQNYAKQNVQKKNYFNFFNYTEYVNRHNELSRKIDEEIRIREKSIINLQNRADSNNNDTKNLNKAENKIDSRESDVRFNMNTANNVKIERKKKSSVKDNKENDNQNEFNKNTDITEENKTLIASDVVTDYEINSLHNNL
jgi:hypothetical protein